MGKRTRRYNKRTRRTRKYVGENSPESSPSTKSETSSKLSVTSRTNRQYIGEPDNTFLISQDTENENVGKSPNISSVSSIQKVDDTNYISIDGEPELRLQTGNCNTCYGIIRHILYKTKMPKTKPIGYKAQSRRDKLNSRIIKILQAQIPPYPIA